MRTTIPGKNTFGKARTAMAVQEKEKTYAIGDEIFTTCGKCKSEMYHVITAMTDDVIKKVMCKGCNSTHVYRPAKEKNAAAKKKATTAAKPKRATRSRKLDWNALSAEIEDDELKEYSMTEDFSAARGIKHQTFGVGVITKVLSDTQIEVLFQDSKRVLVQNYL